MISALSHLAQHFTWCTLHVSSISRVTINSLDILISQFWTSPFSLSGSNCCILTCIQVSQEEGVFKSACIFLKPVFFFFQIYVFESACRAAWHLLSHRYGSRDGGLQFIFSSETQKGQLLDTGIEGLNILNCKQWPQAKNQWTIYGASNVQRVILGQSIVHHTQKSPSEHHLWE